MGKVGRMESFEKKWKRKGGVGSPYYLMLTLASDTDISGMTAVVNTNAIIWTVPNSTFRAKATNVIQKDGSSPRTKVGKR